MEMRADKTDVQAKDLETIRYMGKDLVLRMYHQMLRIRRFEEQVAELHNQRRLLGAVHLYIGQEALAVGVCEALCRNDYITSTHRGHGHCLAKGGSMDRMFAELLGKAAGYCRGKGGSMHIADPDTGNLGANGIVGGSAAIATGAALSAKIRETGQVVACFLGEGALGQGLLYESMNIAALWKIPVIYICENNLYAEFSPYSEITAGSVRARPEAFGILTEEVDAQDVRLVYAVACRLVERLRRGEGPAFLHCSTYRFYGHYMGDVKRSYRSQEEEDFWKNHHDPLEILKGWILEQKMGDVALLEGINQKVQEEVNAGLQFALSASYPDPSEVDAHVYS
jgi:pyruvate dehydrogenase E1 component alpha subunit